MIMPTLYLRYKVLFVLTVCLAIQSSIFPQMVYESSWRVDIQEWTVNDADVFKLQRNDHSQILFLNSNMQILEVSHPYFVHEVIMSKNKKCLLLMIDVADGGGASPSYLIRIKNLEKGVWKTSSPMLKKDLNERSYFIAELGAVSDDGARALLKFSRKLDLPKEDRTIFKHQWETWDLEKGVKLGDGLAIENGVVY